MDSVISYDFLIVHNEHDWLTFCWENDRVIFGYLSQRELLQISLWSDMGHTSDLEQ